MTDSRFRLGNRGTTLFELMTVLAVVGVSTSVAVSRLNAGTASLQAVNRQLVANVRLCRMQAIASGFHCRINVSATGTYSVERMQPPASQGDPWTVDGSQVRTITLPQAVRFGGTGSYEFDTRGTVVGRDDAATINLSDTATGGSASLSIWPSGQVSSS